MSDHVVPRTILVTGASRGLGAAAVRLLAARGCHVIAAGRNAAAVEAVARTAGCGWVQLDLRDETSVQAAARAVQERHGKLDVLVNNAAILLDRALGLMEAGPDMLRETLDTNVTGTFRVARAFVPLLRKSDDPRIVIVSSGAGQLNGGPRVWAPCYSISKTAVNMLTQQLSGALPDMAVNALCPGWCRTEMGGSEAELSPEQGAEEIAWLAVDAPSDVRGQFLKRRQPIPW
ncbi:MAG TPA: SDR family NAD(P)-dependent oxidoreductase [Terrimicrobiaceae bacterium]|nr:SDR family NAD(P)-dependent oxidoreductase [Terrimicrobiaceae bacterium]